MRLDVKQTAAVADNLRAADCQPELIAAFIKCLATGEEQKGATTAATAPCPTVGQDPQSAAISRPFRSSTLPAKKM